MYAKEFEIEKQEVEECRTCGYQWPRRQVVERTREGKILKISYVKPKTCANTECKSPYFSKPYQRKPKN